MSKPLINVGVVFGGASWEHDVSINSAITIVNALKQDKNSNRFEIISIYIDKFGGWWGSECAEKVLARGYKL